MIRPSVLAFAAIALLTAQPALADCRFAAAPAKTLTAEVGATTSSLTGNRDNWDEQYITIADRSGPTHYTYAHVARDQRFGLSDTTYESGAAFPLAPKLVANAMASFSATHNVLPESTLSAGLDLRGTLGYGYQAQYTQRNYDAAVADIATVGADRYVGDRRFGLTLTAAHLSNVPGIAMSAGLTYARYLACDTLSFGVSGGRDAENTGIGSNVAIYQAINYSANALHWFTPHTALSLGAGWYILTGAYDRFEVEVALHERI